MDKISNLDKLKSDPFYKGLINKLTKRDIDFISSFCILNSNTTKDEWFNKVNRLFLNEKKPKNSGLIVEILLVIF